MSNPKQKTKNRYLKTKKNVKLKEDSQLKLQEFFDCIKIIIEQTAILQKFDQLGGNSILSVIDLIMSRDEEYLKVVLTHNKSFKLFNNDNNNQNNNQGNYKKEIKLDKNIKKDIDDIIKNIEIKLSKEE